jgi:hypothetical protein
LPANSDGRRSTHEAVFFNYSLKRNPVNKQRSPCRNA